MLIRCIFILLTLLLAVGVPTAPAQTLQQELIGTPAAEAAEGPTLSQRLESAQRRLQAAKSDSDADEASDFRKREVELLSRIESTLKQLSAAQPQAEQLREDLNAVRQSLADLHKDGVEDAASVSFLRLDQARVDLEVQRRRMKRLGEREADAVLALKKAAAESKERGAARRQAQESLDKNSDDARFQELGEQLSTVILSEELAEETARLRKKELALVRQEIGLQEARIELGEETVARLRTLASFGEEQLREILKEIETTEDRISLDIAAAERFITKYPDLQKRLASQQQALKPASDQFQSLSELITSLGLKLRIHDKSLSLLRDQQVHLTDQKTVWQRRQSRFVEQPERETARDWIEQSQQQLTELDREIRDTENDIADFRVELEKHQKNLPRQGFSRPRELSRIEQQIQALGEPLRVYKQHLEMVRQSQQLHSRLLRELESDSLTASARDRLLDVWQGVKTVWNTELTILGGTGVTIAKVFKAMLVLLAGMIFSRSISRTLGRQVLRRLDIDASATATIQSLFYYSLLVLSGLLALKAISVPLTAFTFLGGAVALGVGFGSQNIINNFISGLILLAERPVRVGDLVEVDELYGNVEHIGARSTVVRTGSNLEIIVPNSSFLQNNVVNFTLSSDKVRTSVTVGVVYGSSPVTVTQLLRRAVVETGRVAKEPPPVILFKDFGDSALVFEVHFWIRMRTVMDRLQVESAVRYRIVQLFEEEGLVIAFPQRDMHLDTSAPLEIKMVPPSPEAPDGSTRKPS